MDCDLDASAKAAASESEQNPREESAEHETVACEEVKLVSIHYPWSDSSDEEEEIVGDCLKRLGYILTFCRSEINPRVSGELYRQRTTMPVS
jgi:hypothetical protein